MRKKVFLILIGVVILFGILDFNSIQAATDAALHVKIDESGPELWEFHSCGLVHEHFDASGGGYTGCPIFLQNENGLSTDHRLIIWVNKGQTIRNSGLSIANEVSYTSCPNGTDAGCKVNSGFNTDAIDVATQSFGTGFKDKCDDNCELSVSHTEYRPKYDLRCTAAGWEWETVPPPPPPGTCTDDGSYYEKGTCIGVNGSFEDRCLEDGVTLREFYCEINKTCAIKDYNCALNEVSKVKCSDGACVAPAGTACDQKVKVVDYDTGQGINEVQIYIPNTDRICYTGADGKCTLFGLKINETYTIKADKENYECPPDNSCRKDITACTAEITLKLERPSCRWYVDPLCGREPCRPRERLYTCGLPGCKDSAECKSGETKCVEDLEGCPGGATCSWQKGSCGYPCASTKRIYTCGPVGCGESATCREGTVDCREDPDCASKPACSWQKGECGKPPCGWTERYSTCGPPGCQPSNECQEGKTKCIEDTVYCAIACKCPDGTVCNQCKSGSPPLYCDGSTKTLINKCSKCGCQSGQTCQTDGSCKAAPSTCGNGVCESGENTTNCPNDCGGGPPSICGNGTLESGEGCDDGNTVSGDGCSSACRIEGGPPSGEARPCGPCTSEGAETDGLTCKDGKWRGCPTDGIVFCNPLQACDFQELVDKIMNFIFLIAVVAVPLIIIIGAFQLLTSGGDPKKIGAGKNMITYALIGLAIILLARGIIAMIQQAIGVE